MEKNNIENFNEFVAGYKKLKTEIGRTIVGQEKVIDDVLIAIFSKGHGLLVGVPGLAKTLLISTIANALDLSFNRIQFTPDLMPSDIVGSEILDKDREFKFIHRYCHPRRRHSTVGCRACRRPEQD